MNKTWLFTGSLSLHQISVPLSLALSPFLTRSIRSLSQITWFLLPSDWEIKISSPVLSSSFCSLHSLALHSSLFIIYSRTFMCVAHFKELNRSSPRGLWTTVNRLGHNKDAPHSGHHTNGPGERPSRLHTFLEVVWTVECVSDWHSKWTQNPFWSSF